MSALFEEAQRIADGFKAQKSYLEDEKARLEQELADVERRLMRADLASERLATFREHIDGRLQCPCCWIEHEMTTDLVAVPGNDREDKFRCRVCTCEISIPA